jgi:TusA-related sulfurtransferase
MKAIVPDYRLDMVGEPCPYPAVATLEAMPSLKKGDSGSGQRLSAVD